MDTNINHGKQANCLAFKEGRGLESGPLNGSSYHPDALEADFEEGKQVEVFHLRPCVKFK